MEKKYTEEEAKKRKIDYIARYQKEHTKKVSLIFNKNTDAELISYLETKESKSGYIKELIYKDMQENISKKLNG